MSSEGTIHVLKESHITCQILLPANGAITPPSLAIRVVTGEDCLEQFGCELALENLLRNVNICRATKRLEVSGGGLHPIVPESEGYESRYGM